MNRRRERPPRWYGHGPSPWFMVAMGVLTIALLALSGCAQAAPPTQAERASYTVGLVAGAYHSHIYATMRRLAAAGVPAQALPEMIHAGCGGVTLEHVTHTVLVLEPRPTSEAEVILQTHAVMDRACAALGETSA